MPRRGLALEGGGAKGSYAFGCLLAFEEHGLKFDAVAGTSVGALNGLLWASGAILRERAIWESINRRTIFETSRGYFFLPVVVFFHFLRAFLQRLRPLPRSFGFKLRLAMALPRPLYFAGTIVVLGTYFVIADRFSSTVRPEWIGLLGVFGGVGLCVLVYLDLTVASLRTPRLKLIIIALTCAMILARFVLMRDTKSLISDIGISVPSLLIGLFYVAYFRWSGAFGLSNTPLRKLVQQIVETGIAVPLYVTLAEERDFYDPDDPQWEEGRGRNLEFRSLQPERQFFPWYFPVHSLDPETATDAIVASAALPFGLVNSIKIDNRRYVDGGVVDNCPIYPLIVTEGCDEVIVIKASPLTPEDSLTPQYLSRIDRLNRVREFAPPTTYWEQDWPDQYLNPLPRPYWRSEPPVVIPLTDYTKTTCRPLFLAPSDSLGNMRSGTMNFTPDYTMRTMERGYKDALAFIKEHSLA